MYGTFFRNTMETLLKKYEMTTSGLYIFFLPVKIEYIPIFENDL